MALTGRGWMTDPFFDPFFGAGFGGLGAPGGGLGDLGFGAFPGLSTFSDVFGALPGFGQVATPTFAGAPAGMITGPTTGGGDYGDISARPHKEAYEPADRRMLGTRGMRYPMDIMESDIAYEIYADVPGFRPDEVTIDLDKDRIVVTGDSERPAPAGRRFARSERMRHRRFRRAFDLPHDVDPDKISASIEGGVLVITLPKLDQPKETHHRRITVQRAPEVPGMISDLARSEEQALMGDRAPDVGTAGAAGMGGMADVGGGAAGGQGVGAGGRSIPITSTGVARGTQGASI